MRIAILGYGVEGKSTEKFLKSSLGNRIAKCQIKIRDIKLQGKNYLRGLEQFDMVVRSPGIPFLTPEIQRVRKKGVVVTSPTKLFFAALEEGFYGSRIRTSRGRESIKLFLNPPLLVKERGLGGEVTVIGITGTKGKGTVATLLYKILRASGKNVYLAGNIGKPMLDLLPRLKKNSIVILELSSFQLQDLDISPHIAAVLDISPDHLNYHKSFKEYLNAKARIVGDLPPRREMKSLFFPPPLRREGVRGRVFHSLVFYFPDNKYSKQIAQKSRGQKVSVSHRSHAFAYLHRIIKMPGFHNLKNASMAAAIGRALGAKETVIKKIIKNFHGLPHRLEFVREISGIKFYNDSASTNPAATIAALEAFDEQKILLAGGQSKGLSFAPLKSAILGSNTKLVILYGRNRHEIRKVLGRMPVNIKLTSDLKSAFKLALTSAARGDVILLSPASTALDQFSGYGERGDYFKNLVGML